MFIKNQCALVPIILFIFFVWDWSIFSETLEDSDIEYEVQKVLSRYEIPVIAEITNRLIHLASEEERVGDYYNSVKHFRQAIYLRKAIGALKNDIPTANLYFLTSLSEYNLQAYCDAKDHALQAFAIYKFLNHKSGLELVASEIQSTQEMCDKNSTEE